MQTGLTAHRALGRQLGKRRFGTGEEHSDTPVQAHSLPRKGHLGGQAGLPEK